MSKDLKPALIKAFYSFMEMETEGYEIYVDTPEKRFKYKPESIWVINPKTKGWIIELENSGKLWYYSKFYDNFLMWFKEELSVFEQLITMWMEDVLKRGVSTTSDLSFSHPALMEDVLKRGVSTTWGQVWPNKLKVEDVLKRGVSTKVTPGWQSDNRVEDVIKRGVSTTNSTIAIRSIEVNDVLKRKTLKTKVYWWKKIINLYKSLTIRSNLS